MLKIKRAANGEVVLTLSGRMDAENVKLEVAQGHCLRKQQRNTFGCRFREIK